MRIRFTFGHIKFLAVKSVFYGTNCIILTKKHGSSTDECHSWSRGKGDQARKNFDFVSVFWQFLFVNVCHIWTAQPHAAMHFCVLRAFWRKRFLFRVTKLFKNSTLAFPDSASFVAWVELIVWYSPTQVFWFVYMRDHNRLLNMKWYICFIYFSYRR